MGEQGSVAWMFERKSQIFIGRDKATEEKLMDLVLEVGGEDIKDDGDQWEMLSDPNAHEAVMKALEGAKIPTEEAAIAMVPKNLLRLEGKAAAAMLRLNEALEEHDDVQSVYSNFDIDEKELESLSA